VFFLLLWPDFGPYIKKGKGAGRSWIQTFSGTTIFPLIVSQIIPHAQLNDQTDVLFSIISLVVFNLLRLLNVVTINYANHLSQPSEKS
jgi:phosphoribulokinase